ncbi:response regulator [Candidatus Magnetominusculus xianensis]|uniref:histidine kinase n=1 Tax=Candidatus Magnetominusculus xianensis TaxID=1748249 RepID=A0ABR5SEL2_9BACT|nr:response regulator [Candidatus Magnetominusculus xianensis]KWT84940.1 multi-sensor signal transduction histidine kinase [Candidatus Magnetominusculus xianensis]MBF0404478.1 response regulator [Nitrospirota bacterium]
MSKSRILIVEDEWIIAANLSSALEDLGYEIASIANTGEDAIKQAEEKMPAIVLMDITLRGKMDGIEAADAIRALYDIPVVYLTSNTDEDTFRRAIDTDLFGYIIKPFEKLELKYAIEMALYKHKMENVIKEKTRQLEELNKNLEIRVKEEIEKGLQKEHLLIHQSKLVSMGEMMVAISHQWRQPLNVIGLLVQDLEEAYEFGEISREYVTEMTRDSMAQLNLMSKTITDFRDFFKPSGEKSHFSVKSAIEECISLIKLQYENNQVYIDFVVQNVNVGARTPIDSPRISEITIFGYPEEYKQVILNLISNARDAIREKRRRDFFSTGYRGEISISLADLKDSVIVEIKDNGPGISQSVIDRIFEPYYTTKEDGIGIGLYMSKVIVENHMGGKLYATSSENGARFTVEIMK